MKITTTKPKFLVLALILFILLASTFPNSIIYANNEFAQIQKSCILYKTANTNIDVSNIFCYLEPSYFVEICVFENDNFYNVNYNGVNGYVEKQNVKICTSIPKTPYPIAKLKTSNFKCNLRSAPSSEATVLMTLPSNTSDINYIGKTYGDYVMDYFGNIWYLVNYMGVYGYIYNGYLANLPAVPVNTENVSFASNDGFLTVNPLSNSTCIILISVIMLPVIAVMVLLFKSPTKAKPKVKVVRQNDKIDYDSLL